MLVERAHSAGLRDRLANCVVVVLGTEDELVVPRLSVVQVAVEVESD
jgi:hypothetical protein